LSCGRDPTARGTRLAARSSEVKVES